MLKALDEEVERLEPGLSEDEASEIPVVRRLRRLRNGYCKINSLPVEIMQWIFRAAHSPVFALSRPCNLSHLAISWTCSLWRDIALQDTRLWSHIDLRFLGLAALFTERSSSCGLSVRSISRTDDEVDWDSQDEEVDEREAFLKRHLDRIKVLHYRPSSPYLADWVCDLPAARLEELKVYAGHTDLMDFDAEWSILPRLFANETPCLRRLDLRDHRLPFTTGSYQNLRSLKLSMGDAGPFLGNDEDLLVIFQECSGLEVLDLQLIWADEPPSFTPTTSRRSRIDMPALRSLRLRLPGTYIDDIMTSVKLPLHQLSSLSIEHSTRSHPTRSRVSEFLRRHGTTFVPFFTAASDMTISRSDDLDYNPDFTPLEIEGSGVAKDGGTVSFLLSGHSPTRRKESDIEFAEVLRAVLDREMPSLNRLVVEDASRYVYFDDSMAPFDVLDFFGGLSNVTELVFIGSVLVNSASHLRETTTDHPKKNVLPNLHTLTLKSYRSVGCETPGPVLDAFFSSFPPHLHTIRLCDCSFWMTEDPPAGTPALQQVPELYTLCSQYERKLVQLCLDQCRFFTHSTMLAQELYQAVRQLQIPDIIWESGVFFHAPDEYYRIETTVHDLLRLIKSSKVSHLQLAMLIDCANCYAVCRMMVQNNGEKGQVRYTLAFAYDVVVEKICRTAMPASGENYCGPCSATYCWCRR